MVTWGHVTNWKQYISSTTMAIKLGNVVTYLEGLLFEKLNYPLITWFCEITWQIKNTSILLQCVKSTNVPAWPPIKSYDLWNKRLRRVAWQIKYQISPLAEDLSVQMEARWWEAPNVNDTWAFDHNKDVRWCNKMWNLYLFYTQLNQDKCQLKKRLWYRCFP